MILNCINAWDEFRKDREYREKAEQKKLELENQEREFKNRFFEVKLIEEQYELLKKMGANKQDISLLSDKLLSDTFKQLKEYQDQKIITTADLLDTKFEQPKLSKEISEQS